MVVISWFINQQTSRVFPILYDDIVLNQKIGQKWGPQHLIYPKVTMNCKSEFFDPTKKNLEFSLFLFPKFDPYMFISTMKTMCGDY